MRNLTILLGLLLIGMLYSASLEAHIISIKTEGSASKPVIMNCKSDGTGPYLLRVRIAIANPTDEYQEVHYKIKNMLTNEWEDKGFLCGVGSSTKECEAVIPIYLGGQGEGYFEDMLLKIYIDADGTTYSKIFSFGFKHVKSPIEKDIENKETILRQRIAEKEDGLDENCYIEGLDNIKDLSEVNEKISKCELRTAYNIVLSKIGAIDDAKVVCNNEEQTNGSQENQEIEQNEGQEEETNTTNTNENTNEETENNKNICMSGLILLSVIGASKWVL